jgi:erythromycin esterase-like protein
MWRCVSGGLFVVGLVGCARAVTPEEVKLPERVAPQIERAAEELVAQAGDARVIGLGEVCHGEAITREVQLAALRRAVVERGCRTVVIEGRFSDATVWNDWAHARGSRAQAPAADFLGRGATHSTHQWADTFGWIRTFNDEHADDDVVIVGTDPCMSRKACLSTIARRLEQHSPREAAALRAWEDLDEPEIAEQLAGWRVPAAIDADERAVLERIRELTQETTLNEEIRGKAPPVRERVMADNVMWALEHGPSCAVVLAHDGHTDVEDGPNPKYPWWIRMRPMGGYLREYLADDYVAVHFTVGEGRFVAYRIVGGLLMTGQLRRRLPMQLFDFSPAIPGSLEHRLRNEAEIAVVPATELPDDPLLVRGVDFAWSRRAARKGVEWQLKRKSAYDVIVYIPTGVPMTQLGT